MALSTSIIMLFHVSDRAAGREEWLIGEVMKKYGVVPDGADSEDAAVENDDDSAAECAICLACVQPGESLLELPCTGVCFCVPPKDDR